MHSTEDLMAYMHAPGSWVISRWGVKPPFITIYPRPEEGYPIPSLIFLVALGMLLTRR